MKFAKSLQRNEVPEWSQWYIDYKGLKKLVRQAVNSAEELHAQTGALSSQQLDRVSAPFYYAVDRNLEVVDTFYNSKFAEYSRRLAHLEAQFAQACANTSHLPDGSSDASESDELVNLLLELRAQLRNLQWYADVNKRGFTKILKKFDKKVGTQAQMLYTSSKVQILGFAHGQEVTTKIELASTMIRRITPNDEGGAMHKDLHSFSGSSQVSLLLNDEFTEVIDANDGARLAQLLQNDRLSVKQAAALLVRAVNLRADAAIKPLVAKCYEQLASKSEDLNGRTALHKVVLAEGRHYVDKERSISAGIPLGLSVASLSEIAKPEELGVIDNSSAALVDLFLQVYSAYADPASLLLTTDHQLRTPLHYAVKYQLTAMVRVLLKWSTVGLQFKDCDGHTAVDVAVINKNPVCLQELLQHSPLPNPKLLLTAVHLNALKVCDVLINIGGYDVNYTNEFGETALHIAVRDNRVSLVSLLLQNNADTEIREATFGWTPLFLSAVDGLIGIADELLSHGALANIADHSGWSPREHAALRGHLKLAKKLPALDFTVTLKDESSGENTRHECVHARKTHETAQLKTFGHRYLKTENEYLVLVTLGSKDLRLRDQVPVKLASVPPSELGSTKIDTALSLVVSASHTHCEPHVVDLPIPELGMSTEPIPFYTTDPENLRLVFDLIPSYSADQTPLARGVFALPPHRKLQCLDQSTHTVPILEASSLRTLGTVKFEFVLVSPFVHPGNNVSGSNTYWRSLLSTRVIGHRGLGKNTLEKKSLQLGENTVESFIQASNLGASYVEFDVQLTRDNVPVIYHDFLVSESGYDVPMHALTLEQFMQIHEPRQSRGRSPVMTDDGGMKPEPKRSSSAQSRRAEKILDYEDTLHRMRHTRDYKVKGYKGNVRGLHIQSKFATLSELFDALPENLGFNIEFKYPMLDEAEAEDMDCTFPEINKFVDTILNVIFDKKKHRDIIFSSFNPDVCVLLSFKQPSVPVLFLTESGTEPMQDIRASSLQEAVRFAKRYNLLGLVSAAEPLIMCPRLVQVVKESGLVLFTYGTLNNVPENASLQLKSGVDAVIVDSVLAITNELTKLVTHDAPLLTT